jgi:hypothetical protein
MGNLDKTPPVNVRRDARRGLDMKKAGFAGGIETGLFRAKQLATHSKVPLRDLIVMRNWFARHGPSAKNGGTSYPGYVKWVKDGKPMVVDGNKNKYRGAVAWLIWGGDSAYRWIKQLSKQKQFNDAGMKQLN